MSENTESLYKMLLVCVVFCLIFNLSLFHAQTAAKDLIVGWSEVAGYTNRTNWHSPERGNQMILVRTQLKNVSSLTQQIGLDSILLKDSKDNSYKCVTAINERKSLGRLNLLPGEVFSYQLAFEVPSKIKPDSLVIWGANDYGPSVKIPINSNKKKLLKSTYQSVKVLPHDKSISIGKLEISQSTESNRNIGKVTFTLDNTGSSVIKQDTIGCGIFGCFVGLKSSSSKEESLYRIYSPFLKGSHGHYAEPLERFVAQFPSQIPKGGQILQVIRFKTTNLQKPFYLGIGFMYGTAYKFKKNVWVTN